MSSTRALSLPASRGIAGLSFVLAAAVLLPSTSRAGEPAGLVIPAGREDTIARMLGRGESLPGDCRVAGIRIDVSSARAEYQCAGGRQASVRLVHPSAASMPLAMTPQFAIVAGEAGASADLVKAVEALVRREEASWTWQAPGTPGTQPAPVAPPPAPQPVAPSEPEFTPDLQAEYDAAENALKNERAQEAFDRLKALARKHPSASVLGLLVASAAAITDRPEVWQAAVADADAHPDEPLANFIAGVSLHYYAHNWARSRAEKTGYYERAIGYLLKTLPAYEFSPRVWIYLSVSYFRTGRQAEAEAAIAKAIAHAGDTRDADAWYCRAEILHVKDPGAAIADLDVYRQIMGENAAKGAIHNESKDRKVMQMRERLERTLRGEEPPDPDDMFDPPASDWDEAWMRHGRTVSMVVVGVLALVAIGIVLVVRRRRKA